VIIHQKPVILTKQAIVLVNVEIGGYNGTDRVTTSIVRNLDDQQSKSNSVELPFVVQATGSCNTPSYLRM